MLSALGLSISAIVAPVASAQPSREAFTVSPREDDEHDGHHPPACSIMPGVETERGLSIPFLWPGGVVPYVFSANTTSGMQAAARDAMDEIEAISAVTFVPRTTEFDYVFIQDSTVNSSFVGRQGGSQTLNMYNWGWKYIIVHELMHALGIWHEQQRSDRDTYVQIEWANIQTGQDHNFTIRTGTNHGPYDFDSVMHYSQCSFSDCPCSATCRTITALPGYEQHQSTMGQRSQMSDGDIATINDLYDGGAVENLTSGLFYSTLTDAIAAAAPGHVLLAEPGQFSRRPDYNLAGKALTVQSSADLETAVSSNFVLADLASLEAAPGATMRIRGDLTVPPFAAAVAAADVFDLRPGGAIVAVNGATASIDATTRIDLFGDLEVADGASVLLDAPAAKLDVSAAMELAPGALVSLVSGAALQLDGEAILDADATLASLGPLTSGANSDIRFLASQTGMAVEAGALTINGAVDAQAFAAGTLSAPAISGVGSLIAGEGATLTLDTEDFSLGGEGVITATLGGVVHAASPTASVAIDGRRMVLQSAGAFQSAAPLTIGALNQPGFFEDRTVSGQQTSPQAVAIGDIDDDGHPDVVVVSLSDGRVAWYRNNPATQNRFGVASFIDLAASGPLGVDIGDVDGDGHLDVVVASTLGSAVYWYEHNGAATPGFTRRTVVAGLPGASSVTIVDLDDDGDNDILSTARTGARVTWHENLGGVIPTFAARTIDGALPGATDVEVADMDGDGDLDIVATGQTAGEVRWYEREPGLPAVFTQHQLLTSGGGAYALALGDLNADGAADIVVAERSANEVTMRRNDGAADPAFIETTIATQPTPTALDIVDLDGDGDLDVLAVSLQAGLAAWYANDGAPMPAFMQGTVKALIAGATGIAGADLDGDADVDVVISITNPSSVVWEAQQVRFTRVETGATLASNVSIDHHRTLELIGGVVDTPTLNIVGAGRLTGSGDITGDLRVESTLRFVTALTIGGSVTMTDGASVDLAGADLAVAGDFTIESTDPATPDLAGLALTVGGAPSSVVEATTPDTGPASPALFASFRVPAGATVDLANAFPNAVAGREAIYTGALIIEPGATLRTNGVRIYYGALTLDGVIEGAEHAAAIQACAGDLSGETAVDGADLGLLLGA
ncbi:MAG: FG-GAP-like repeat-containing protein, partial [Phycisphaerales bacterium]